MGLKFQEYIGPILPNPTTFTKKKNVIFSEWYKTCLIIYIYCHFLLVMPTTKSYSRD